jgi:hypothetical protein
MGFPPVSNAKPCALTWSPLICKCPTWMDFPFAVCCGACLATKSRESSRYLGFLSAENIKRIQAAGCGCLSGQNHAARSTDSGAWVSIGSIAQAGARKIVAAADYGRSAAEHRYPMCRRSMGRPYRRASRTNSITSPPRCLDLWNWRRNKQSRTRRCSSVLGEIPITSGSVDFIWGARPLGERTRAV